MAYSLAEIKKNRTTGLTRPNQGGSITRSDGRETIVQPGTPSTGLSRTTPRPNQGGTITRAGVTTSYAPSPAAQKTSANSGGTITRNGQTRSYAPSPGFDPKGGSAGGTIDRTNPPTVQLSPDVSMTAPSRTVIPPSPPAIRSQMTPAIQLGQPAPLQPALDTPGTPVTSATTAAAPQTEGDNPLTGDGNAEAGGTTDAVNPAKAMGFIAKGAAPQQGQDQNMGGSGPYARKFGNPGSAKIYDSYVKRIFG